MFTRNPSRCSKFIEEAADYINMLDSSEYDFRQDDAFPFFAHETGVILSKNKNYTHGQLNTSCKQYCKIKNPDSRFNTPLNSPGEIKIFGNFDPCDLMEKYGSNWYWREQRLIAQGRIFVNPKICAFWDFLTKDTSNNTGTTPIIVPRKRLEMVFKMLDEEYGGKENWKYHSAETMLSKGNFDELLGKFDELWTYDELMDKMKSGTKIDPEKVERAELLKKLHLMGPAEKNKALRKLGMLKSPNKYRRNISDYQARFTSESKFDSTLDVVTEGTVTNKYYAFDWDDNIMFMPTKIYTISNTKKLVPISTEEFAEYRSKIGNEPFKLRGKTIVGYPTEFNPFRNFRVEGDDQFKRDVFTGKPGPAWNDFVSAINGGRILAIITARGHHPNTLRDAVYSLLRNNHNGLSYEECLKSLRDFHKNSKHSNRQITDHDLMIWYFNKLCKWYPVSYGKDAATSPEVLKQKALREFMNHVDRKFKSLHLTFRNKVANKFTIGFSDDDPGNVKSIYGKFKKNKNLTVFSTHGGNKKQYKESKLFIDESAEDIYDGKNKSLYSDDGAFPFFAHETGIIIGHEGGVHDDTIGFCRRGYINAVYKATMAKVPLDNEIVKSSLEDNGIKLFGNINIKPLVSNDRNLLWKVGKVSQGRLFSKTNICAFWDFLYSTEDKEYEFSDDKTRFIVPKDRLEMVFKWLDAEHGGRRNWKYHAAEGFSYDYIKDLDEVWTYDELMDKMKSGTKIDPEKVERAELLKKLHLMGPAEKNKALRKLGMLKSPNKYRRNISDYQARFTSESHEIFDDQLQEAVVKKDSNIIRKIRKGIKGSKKSKQFKPKTFGFELEFDFDSEEDFEENLTYILQNDLLYMLNSPHKPNFNNYLSSRARDPEDILKEKFWYYLESNDLYPPYDSIEDWINENPKPDEYEESALEEWKYEKKYVLQQIDRHGGRYEEYQKDFVMDLVISGEWRDYLEEFNYKDESGSDSKINEINHMLNDLGEATSEYGSGDYETWQVGMDDTLVEVASKILTTKDIPVAKEVLEYLSQYIDNTHGSTSAHVHIGIDTDFTAFDTLAVLSMIDEDKAFGESPNRSKMFSRPKQKLIDTIFADLVTTFKPEFGTNKYDFESHYNYSSDKTGLKKPFKMYEEGLKKILDSNSLKYDGLNTIHKNTLEFRYLSSEILKNVKGFLEWINYYHLLIDLAKRRKRISLESTYGWITISKIEGSDPDYSVKLEPR